MPVPYLLSSRFVRPDLEQSLLAALAAKPDLYWQTLDLLHPDTFTEERRQLFIDLAAAIEQERSLPAVEGAEPASDPLAAARELADLHQRRMMADLLQQGIEELDKAESAAALISRMESGLNYVQQAVKEARAGRGYALADLFPELLNDLMARRQAVKAFGKATVGLSTGIPMLDKLLGGLQTGIHLLAAEPGAGKTSLALQIAVHVARSGTPALFVSFEEALRRLTLKVLANVAGLEWKRYADGIGDPTDVERAMLEYGPQLVHLRLVEGTRRTTPAQVKAEALQAMNRAGTKRCLIVIDYLQRWAATLDPEALDLGDSQRRRLFMDYRHIVSSLVSELRELAFRLDSPILVISSQNRGGQGSDRLTSLKESGDLEYSADSAWFLVKADKRHATPPARAVDLSLEKNRYGDKGCVKLIFMPQFPRLREEEAR